MSWHAAVMCAYLQLPFSTVMFRVLAAAETSTLPVPSPVRRTPHSLRSEQVYGLGRQVSTAGLVLTPPPINPFFSRHKGQTAGPLVHAPRPAAEIGAWEQFVKGVIRQYSRWPQHNPLSSPTAAVS